MKKLRRNNARDNGCIFNLCSISGVDSISSGWVFWDECGNVGGLIYGIL